MFLSQNSEINLYMCIWFCMFIFQLYVFLSYVKDSLSVLMLYVVMVWRLDVSVG